MYNNNNTYTERLRNACSTFSHFARTHRPCRSLYCGPSAQPAYCYVSAPKLRICHSLLLHLNAYSLCITSAAKLKLMYIFMYLIAYNILCSFVREFCDICCLIVTENPCYARGYVYSCSGATCARLKPVPYLHTAMRRRPSVGHLRHLLYLFFCCLAFLMIIIFLDVCFSCQLAPNLILFCPFILSTYITNIKDVNFAIIVTLKKYMIFLLITYLLPTLKIFFLFLQWIL